MNVSLDNRTFIPIENSAGGVVDDQSQFHFQQNGKQFSADYSGGDILIGHIIGRLTSSQSGEMLYHCLTRDMTLKAGQADAAFDVDDEGHLHMRLKWQWLSGANGSGTSHYIETNKRTA